MWNYNGYSDSYDNLKTFREVLQEQTQAVVFGDTQIDEATQTAIVNWFQFRKVSDNDKFVAYFQRLLKANEEQYINYMRIQTVQFDPLVTQYMERLLNRDGSSSEKDKDTTVNTGNDTVNTSGTAKTNNSDNSVTDSRGVDSTTQNGETGDKSMNAQLPQSATGAGAGLPENLNWKYATQQDERKGTSKNNSKSESTGKTTNTGTSTGTASNNQTTKSDRTNQTVKNGERSGSNSEVVKERMTGRSGEPTSELLKKAVSYITTTNGFFWLVDKLEAAFMAIYE